MSLFSYILMAMLFLSPLHKNIHKEDPAERLNRYESIAKDIVEIAMDSNEAPAFNGKYAREKTALLMASMAAHESGGYDKSVDFGLRRGIFGEVCIMQVMPNMINSQHNYSVEYLKNRKNCLKAGLAIARYSNCPGGIRKRMRIYVSGRCSKHEDPQKEASISKAAHAEVRGYIRFYSQYPINKFVVK